MARRSAIHLVIAGGGTGGHLFPGLALAQAVERLEPSARVTFVGSAAGIEARVVPRHGYSLELVGVRGLKGERGARLFKALARLPLAGAQALRLRARLRPSLVVSVGGYAAGPFTMACALSGVPCALLEQNTVPGRTNRALGHIARAIYLTYPSSASYFPAERCYALGNPLRSELSERAVAHQWRAPGPREPISVLVLGGSGGSRAINQGVPAGLAEAAGRGRALRVVHQIGAQDASGVAQAYAAAGIEAEIVAFIDEMADAYERAHVVIGRAGATTIAELTAFGLPALFIPFAGAADDHQTKNAQVLVDAGAARQIAERAAEPAAIADLLDALLEPGALAAAADASRALGRPDAARQIARDCLARLA